MSRGEVNLPALLKVSVAVVAWGASFIATKFALRDVSPVTVVWLRFGIGLLVIGGFVFARRQMSLPRRSELGYFALLGFLGIAYHQWLQATGLQTAHASTTAWIVATTPVFMALLGWLVLKERLTVMQVLGIGLAAVGVILVVTGGDFSALGWQQSGMPGNLYILASAPNWAIFSVLSRRGLKRHPAARMMLFVMGFGWLIVTLVLFAPGGLRLQEVPHLTREGWLGVLFLGFVCSGLAYVFWYDGLQVMPVGQVGALLYVEPLVAMVIAAWLLDEQILLASLLGGMAILGGVYLVERQGKHASVVEEGAS